MRFCFSIAIILQVFFVYGQNNESFKVMTWNIWHGGLHGEKNSNFEKDTTNTINILKVLREEEPDILLMQETYCCGMEIAREAGFMYSWRASSNLSIHSKYPINDTIAIYRAFNSHAAVINIQGQKILFINLWLHYLPDYFEDIKHLSPDSLIALEGTTRLKEISAILECVDSLENQLNIPIVIGGDFNSGSHLDWVESTRDAHYGKLVEWPVSKKMLNKGYRDSFREAHPDPAKSLQGTWGFLSDDIISDRIDFIYCKGKNLDVIDSKIIMNDPPGGFFNSDHRAILTEIRMK